MLNPNEYAYDLKATTTRFKKSTPVMVQTSPALSALSLARDTTVFALF
jgi:hypothetical protein